MPDCQTTWHYIPELHTFECDLLLTVNGGGSIAEQFCILIYLQDMLSTPHTKADVQCDDKGAMNVYH